jgi:hypothetical protein
MGCDSWLSIYDKPPMLDFMRITAAPEDEDRSARTPDAGRAFGEPMTNRYRAHDAPVRTTAGVAEAASCL